jgi:hypothetical protein
VSFVNYESNFSAIRKTTFILTSFLFIVSAIPAALLGQAQLRTSFVVRLKYMKIDLPSSSSLTCLAVFPDGGFHMEKASDWPRSAPQVFEDSIPKESVDSLRAVLEVQGLKDLRQTKEDVGVISQGAVLWVLIPRGETFQLLSFASLENSGAQHGKALPAPLEPLVQWFLSTTKTIDRRKLRSLKSTTPTMCGLGSER